MTALRVINRDLFRFLLLGLTSTVYAGFVDPVNMFSVAVFARQLIDQPAHGTQSIFLLGSNHATVLADPTLT